MQAVILCGIQATGKSTFCKEQFFHSHIRLNLDMLRTRARESTLFKACLAAKQSVVIDNTNPTRADRAKYIIPAKDAKFRVIGYYFASAIESALKRNQQRASKIPEIGIKATHAQLQLPELSEGFDELFYVSLTPAGFDIKPWNPEGVA